MIAITVEPECVNGTTRVRIEVRDGDRLCHIDRINLDSATSRRRFCNDVARKLNNSESADDVETLLMERVSELRNAPPPEPATKPSAEALLEQTPADIKDDALSKLQDPNLIDEICDDFGVIGIAGDINAALTVYEIGVSRLLERPMAGIVRGASASGKSYIIARVAWLFPPEVKLEAHYLTPKSLFYLPDDALVHRFVIAGERPRSQDDEQADASKAVREMISDGILRCITVEQIDGRLQTVECVKPGPIAYVESTTASRIFEEDLNRCIVVPVDESPEQTARIIQAAGQAAADAADSNITGRIVQVHHAMQRLLQPYQIAIPFARLIADRFPTDRVEARRLMPHLISTIKSVCLLRQYQKRPQDGILVADRADYEVALELIAPTLRRLSDAADSNVLRVLAAITKHVDDGDEFTRAKAAGWAGVQQADCNGRLRILAERGFIVETQEGRGNRPARLKLAPGAPEPDAASDLCGFPTPAEIPDQGGAV